MNYLDISLLIVLGGFVLYGFWFGLVHVVGSIIGLLVGAFIAARFYVFGAYWLSFLGNDNLAKVLSFIVIFILVTKLVGLLFWFVDKTLKFIAIIPFVMTFNRLLGAMLGFVEGILALGFAVWFISRYPWSDSLAAAMTASKTAGVFNAIGSILALLAPTALKAVQTIF